MRPFFLILGLVILVGLGYLFFPSFFAREVQEGLDDISGLEGARLELVANGRWEGVEGYEAKGTALLLRSDGRYFLRFEDDFYVTAGPDLFIYLGNDGVYEGTSRVGSLKANSGSQNYELLFFENQNIPRYREVWIVSRILNKPHAKAELRFF